jgi:hypothetical protein
MYPGYARRGLGSCGCDHFDAVGVSYDRGRHEIAGQVESSQQPGAACGLVTSNADPDTHCSQRGKALPHIGIQILGNDARAVGGIEQRGLEVEVEAGPEDLEDLGVVAAGGDHPAECRHEGQARNVEPIRPQFEPAGLVHEGFADVENHCFDHLGQLTDGFRSCTR